MSRAWDNPVARHAERLIARSGGLRTILLVLAGCGGLGLLLQRYWMEWGIYNLLQPSFLTRWWGLVLVSETMIVLPWAAVRGALLWRRLQREGHLDEYRRSRMSPAGIAAGLTWAALRPVSLFLGLSLVLALAVGALADRAGLMGTVTAHLLLAALALAFGSLGLWLGGRLHYPGAAIPLALAVLAGAICGIGALNPWYRGLGDPTGWIYAFLLPNPVTAVGNVLNTDVLRFSWIYEHVRAVDYFYIYPPAWQTGLLYLGGAAVLFAALTARIARYETR